MIVLVGLIAFLVGLVSGACLAVKFSTKIVEVSE